MVISLLIIAIAFYLMLRETDYLRVRLPVGKIPDKTPEYTPTQDTVKPIPANYKASEFTSCEVASEDFKPSEVINIGAKIL